MNQIIEQTHEEKVKMYMKLPKKQLIEMLIECNRIIDSRPVTYWDTHKKEQVNYAPYGY